MKNTNEDFVGDLIKDKKEEKKKEDFKSMEEVLAKVKGPVIPKVGDVLEGEIIEISAKEIHIDIPGIGTGVIIGRELGEDTEFINKLKVGDKLKGSVIELENKDGEVELSLRKASREQAWKDLGEKRKKGEIITLKIQEANRGGLMTTIDGIKAFMPVSQLIPEHYPRVEGGEKTLILEKLNEFVGENFKVKVIDVDQEEDKLIISEKEAYTEQQKDMISKYKVGDKVKGKVSAVTNFGAFMKFNSLEGLIHISELAWQRIEDPRDIVKIGDDVKAEIIAIDEEKISLSMKRLKEDPWVKDVEKYKVEQIVEGEVTKVNPFGAFVRLDNKIQGLAHISELSSKPIKGPGEVLSKGDKKKFKILSIEPEDHRLGLSLRALEEEKKKNSKSQIPNNPASRDLAKPDK